MPRVRKECAAAFCSNTTDNCDLSFFAFTRNNPKCMQKWLDSIQLKEATHKERYLCSDHFERKAFTSTFKRRLLPKAIPTIQRPRPFQKAATITARRNTEVDMAPVGCPHILANETSELPVGAANSDAAVPKRVVKRRGRPLRCKCHSKKTLAARENGHDFPSTSQTSAALTTRRVETESRHPIRSSESAVAPSTTQPVKEEPQENPVSSPSMVNGYYTLQYQIPNQAVPEENHANLTQETNEVGTSSHVEPVYEEPLMRDNCTVFGDYMAHKLRLFDDMTRVQVEHKINCVLHDAEMNALRVRNYTGSSNRIVYCPFSVRMPPLSQPVTSKHS